MTSKQSLAACTFVLFALSLPAPGAWADDEPAAPIVRPKTPAAEPAPTPVPVETRVTTEYLEVTDLLEDMSQQELGRAALSVRPADDTSYPAVEVKEGNLLLSGSPAWIAQVKKLVAFVRSAKARHMRIVVPLQGEKPLALDFAPPQAAPAAPPAHQGAVPSAAVAGPTPAAARVPTQADGDLEDVLVRRRALLLLLDQAEIEVDTTTGVKQTQLRNRMNVIRKKLRELRQLEDALRDKGAIAYGPGHIVHVGAPAQMR